jgi:hypothetical protein
LCVTAFDFRVDFFDCAGFAVWVECLFLQQPMQMQCPDGLFNAFAVFANSFKSKVQSAMTKCDFFLYHPYLKHKHRFNWFCAVYVGFEGSCKISLASLSFLNRNNP